jgi:MFS family permease
MRELRKMLGESAGSLRRVFRNPGLRRIDLAFAGSIIGDWAYAVAVSLYAYRRGGATAVGVLAVARYSAQAVLAPFLSTLGDRQPRKRVMLGADVARAGMVAGAAVLVAGGGPALAVYILAVCTSALGTAFRPAQAALLPTLATSPGELTAANAAASSIESIGFFAGPALAALLLSITSLQTVFALNAASYVWSAFLIFGLRVDAQPAAPAREKTNPIKEATAGIRTIRADRDLRLLVALLFGQTVVAGASMVFSVAIALRLLHFGNSGLGTLNSMLGIGAFAGAFAALALAHRKRLSFDFGVGVILWSAPLLLIAVWPTVASAVVMMILLGMGNSLVDINVFTVIQRVAPPKVMSRVFGALESAVIGGMAVGALAMPLLISTIGLRAGLAVLGLSVSIAVVLSIGGLNRIDSTTLAPAKLPWVTANSIFAPLSVTVQERLARSLHRHPGAGGRRRRAGGDARRPLLPDREREGGGDVRRRSAQPARSG